MKGGVRSSGLLLSPTEIIDYAFVVLLSSMPTADITSSGLTPSAIFLSTQVGKDRLPTIPTS